MSFWMKLILMARFQKLVDQTKPSIPNLDIIESKLSFKMKLGKRKRRVKVKYSVVKGDPTRVIHHFHGFMGTEKDFYNPGLSSTSGWVSVYPRLNNPKPTIICYSHDKSWLLSPYPGREKGDKDAVIESSEEILLRIEKKHGLRPFKRIVTGTSMGGFNAVMRWMFSDMYEAACFHVPLMQKPYEMKGIATLLVRGQFTMDEWLRINPLGLYAGGFISKDMAPVHLQYSQLDQFGFYEPDKLFEKVLRKAGVDITVTENTGDHSDMAPFAMAEFINKHLK